jgi:hypothetical protein
MGAFDLAFSHSFTDLVVDGPMLGVLPGTGGTSFGFQLTGLALLRP